MILNNKIGKRIKDFYEKAYRFFLTKRTYTIIRIDGINFSTYTQSLEKPFDGIFTSDLIQSAIYLCKKVQGCKLAFVQSDEISIVLTDFDNNKTEMWLGGNLQKMCSTSASSVTAKFNQLRPGIEAEFDSRVFQIPAKSEVLNYFIDRQQNATANSISMATSMFYEFEETNNKTTNQMQDMLFKKGVNWNDYEGKFKRGVLVAKVDGEWQVVNTPIFTKEDVLNQYIPDNK